MSEEKRYIHLGTLISLTGYVKLENEHDAMLLNQALMILKAQGNMGAYNTKLIIPEHYPTMMQVTAYGAIIINTNNTSSPERTYSLDEIYICTETLKFEDIKEGDYIYDPTKSTCAHKVETVSQDVIETKIWQYNTYNYNKDFIYPHKVYKILTPISELRQDRKINVAQEIHKQWVEDKQKRIEILKRDIEVCRTQLRNSCRALEIEEIEYNKQGLKELNDGIEKSIELIKTNKSIESIIIVKEGISVVTKTLYITEPQSMKRYLGGKYSILMPFDMKKNIEVNNLTHVVRGYEENMHHPHVFEDGHMCIGNVSAMIADAQSKRDYYSVLCTVLNFLQTCNVEDIAGEKVYRWAEVNENNEIINPDSEGDYICSNCGEEIDEDEHEYECCECGCILCKDCVTWVNENDCYCPSCRDEHCDYCEGCGEWVLCNNAEWVEGVIRCHNCIAEECDRCANCGEHFFTDQMKEIDGEYYCTPCYKECTASCDRCGEIYLTNELKEGHNGLFCDKCYNPFED